MFFKKTAFALFLLSTFAVGGSIGCAAEVEDEAEGTSEDDLSASAQKLVGAYQDAGTAVQPPTVKGLVLKSDRSFFADFDSGIRPLCLPGGPCPSPVARVTGTFTAGTKYLTLSPKAGDERSSYHGRYTYKLNGSKLTLTRSAWGSWSDSLSKEISHCQKAADCYEQSIIVPACLGEFRCGSANSCIYSCGQQCGGRTQDTCSSLDGCQPQFGPSSCSPDGTRCTRDFVYKGCKAR